VAWFEEPVPGHDTEGLRLLRERAPAGMDISAGEYGWGPADFLRLLQAQAVDVLQADATRCGGLTGFLGAAALAQAFELPLSSHCAPALHVHACCAVPNAVHLEWFHDHQRIERLLFDGALQPADGRLAPELSRPGLGLVFKERDAEEYAL
jgi:L-alanine-DL-glutamate epimerase-like enolase superfamily enzyme